MTMFGKILIGVLLVFAGFLIFKSYNKTVVDKEVVTEVNQVNNQSTATSSSSSIKNTSTTDKDTEDFNGSVQDLVKRGGSYKCVVDQENNVSHLNGMVYISEKHMRGDFDMVVSVASTTNATTSKHIISDGDFIYKWSGGSLDGVKLAFDENASSTSSSSLADRQDFNFNQKLDYKCVSWTINPDKFVLPTEVNFKEIN